MKYMGFGQTGGLGKSGRKAIRSLCEKGDGRDNCVVLRKVSRSMKGSSTVTMVLL